MKYNGKGFCTEHDCTTFKESLAFFPEAKKLDDCVFDFLGLTVCDSENEELRVKLLRLKLQALVRSEGEKAADQALETFSQVIGLAFTYLPYSYHSMSYVKYFCTSSCSQLGIQLFSSLFFYSLSGMKIFKT